MGHEWNEAEARAEIVRLTAKQQTIDDEDIRLAIQARIDTLETEIYRNRNKPDDAPAPEAATTPASTPEQLAEADRLIREARVEKMRGNNSRALEIMRQASQVAPDAPTVLEALGDDLAERKQLKEASMVYGRAAKLDPSNVGLERKFANTVLVMGSLGSLDDQMRMSLSDPMFLTAGDQVASIGSARLLNVLFPGAGHIVLGRTATGFGLLAGWILSVIFAVLFRNDLSQMLHLTAGGHGRSNIMSLLPLFSGVVIWVVGLASLGGPTPAARQKVERPRPPVDLPFD